MEVKRATLRMYANSASAIGHEAHAVTDTSWDERRITYQNAPAVGAALGSSGVFSTTGSVDVDVTALITGNGTFSLALTTAGSTAISYRSREAGHVPELVVETGPPAPPPSTGTLVEEDFESGDLARWDTVRGLVVAQDVVKNGVWGARATSTDGVQAYASTSLGGFTHDATFSMWVNVLSRGDNPVYLMRARRTGDNPLLGVYVSPTGRLAFRNDLSGGGGATTSTTVVGPGWHELTVHVVVGGVGGSLAQVWLDDVLAIERTETLGTDPMTRVEIGNRGAGGVFDVAFDDVRVIASS